MARLVFKDGSEEVKKLYPFQVFPYVRTFHNKSIVVLQLDDTSRNILGDVMFIRYNEIGNYPEINL